MVSERTVNEPFPIIICIKQISLSFFDVLINWYIQHRVFWMKVQIYSIHGIHLKYFCGMSFIIRIFSIVESVANQSNKHFQIKITQVFFNDDARLFRNFRPTHVSISIYCGEIFSDNLLCSLILYIIRFIRTWGVVTHYHLTVLLLFTKLFTLGLLLIPLLIPFKVREVSISINISNILRYPHKFPKNLLSFHWKLSKY